MSKTFTIVHPSKVDSHQPLANKVTIDLENDSLTFHDHEIKDYKGLIMLFKVILNTARDGEKRAEFEILENYPGQNEITIKGDNLYFVEKCEQLELFDNRSSQDIKDYISQINNTPSNCTIL